MTQCYVCYIILQHFFNILQDALKDPRLGQHADQTKFMLVSRARATDYIGRNISTMNGLTIES